MGNKTSMPRLMIQDIGEGRRMGKDDRVSNGFMKSISNDEIPKPSINVEVALDWAKFEGIFNGLDQRIDWQNGLGYIPNNGIEPQTQIWSLEVSGPFQAIIRMNQERKDLQQKKEIYRNQEEISNEKSKTQMRI